MKKGKSWRNTEGPVIEDKEDRVTVVNAWMEDLGVSPDPDPCGGGGRCGFDGVDYVQCDKHYDGR